MALNNATHANFGISSGGITPSGAAATATGLKRKSEVHDESEERVTKVAKKNEGSYVSVAATMTTATTPGNVPPTSAVTTPGTGVSTKDRDHLPNPEEDTATRLLKLRGRLNSISSTAATSVEIGEGRSRGEHSREREERSVGPSRPVSRATTDRTRVDSGVERVEEIRVGRSEETAKEKASPPRQPNSIEKKKLEIVKGEKEVRSSALKEEQPRLKTKKGDEEVGSGPGLFKFNVPTSSAKSTTPPGSPLPETGILTKKAAAATQAATKEAADNVTLQQQSVFKPLKGSIFSALPSKVDKPKGIFSRTPSQQFTPVTYFAGPQYGLESQSTEDTESQVQSVFDAPTSNKGKSSISTTVTAESQSDKIVPTKADDNTGTTMKSGGTDQFSGWGEEGLTATWLSKGDETTGVEKKQNNRMPGAFGDEDKEEEGNWEEEDPDNVTNNRWNALKAEAMGGHQRDKEEELETPMDENEDEEMMDDVDEDEVEEIVQDEVEEILEEEEEPPKPTPAASVGSGIIASIGSFTSKFGLKSLKAAAANAEKERVEKEKKEARLKEIEARRRAAAQQKKAEEEARQKELEKKRKADEERRKKEKADTTLNQSFKPKKPAVPTVPSSDKKPELIKKQPSKLGLGLGNNSTTLLGASSSSKIPAA
ncbi:hypothetical protein FRC17_007372, partial [Serendipita sp. 399]